MFLFLSFSDFRHERLVYETLHPVDFFECLVIMDILCASEESNAPNCLDGDSMIVCCFCFYHAIAEPFHRIVAYSPQRKTEVFVLMVGIWSWDWLLA